MVIPARAFGQSTFGSIRGIVQDAAGAGIPGATIVLHSVSLADRIGNLSVGILQGPGTAAVSIGVAKRFLIYERVNGRFETTFTNVLNHTNFAPPATVIDNPQFRALIGPQTAENAGNRTGQVARRFDF